MKRCLLISILLFLLLESSHAQDFSINGAISGVAYAKVSIYGFYGNNMIPLDTFTTDKQGEVSIPINYPSVIPGFIRLSLSISNYFDIIVSGKEDVIISSDSLLQNTVIIESRENKKLQQLKQLQEGMKALVNSINITLSKTPPNSKDYLDKSVKRDSIIEQSNQYIIKLCDEDTSLFFSLTSRALITPTQLNHDETYIREHYFDNINFSNSNILHSTLLPNQYMRYFGEHIDYNEDGFKLAIDLILSKAKANNDVYAFSLEYLMTLFGRVGPELIFEYLVENYYSEDACTVAIQDTSILVSAQSYLNLQTGMILPSISAPNENNKYIKLDSVLDIHDYTIILFWASFCHFCQNEMPALIDLYNDNHDKNVEIYAISLDDNQTEWLDFIKINKITWTNVCDFKGWKSPIVKSIKVNKTPTFYLVNNKGVILGKSHNVNSMSILLHKLVNSHN